MQVACLALLEGVAVDNVASAWAAPTPYPSHFKRNVASLEMLALTQGYDLAAFSVVAGLEGSVLLMCTSVVVSDVWQCPA